MHYCMMAIFRKQQTVLVSGLLRQQEGTELLLALRCAYTSCGLHSVRFLQGQVSLAFQLASVNKDPV